MAVSTTNPPSGTLSDQTNPANGSPTGFPVGPNRPQNITERSDHQLLITIARELRILNMQISNMTGNTDDLDTWRTTQGMDPNLYPLA